MSGLVLVLSTAMPATPPRIGFKHHGEPGETRERWAASRQESATSTETGRAPVALAAPAPAPPPATEPASPPARFLRSPYGDSTPDIWGGLNGGKAWAHAPTIDPQRTGWWCICYKTAHGADHTACRRQRAECEELRELIQTRGSSSILQGTASPNACKHVRGRYPWLKLGHHASWRASEYSDAPGETREVRERRRATQAPGTCAF